MHDIDYIVFDFGKVLLKYIDGKKHFYKENNGLITNLTNEELIKVEAVFNNNDNNYYTERLEELVSNNNLIEHREYVINLLRFLENLIPINARDNFYRNLKTLKLKLNLNIDYTKKQEFDSSDVRKANYNARDNILTIDEDTLRENYELASYSKEKEEFFIRELLHILLHELSHMASSNYDEYTGILLSGFDKYPFFIDEESNRGLTEGMTEMIASYGVPSRLEASSLYHVETLFVGQLLQIISRDIILDSYFANKGTKELEIELNKLIPDKQKSWLLFRKTENNFHLRNYNNKQSLLANIQSTLIEYLKEKLLKAKNNGTMTIEEINTSLEVYEKMLVTEDKLLSMKKDPNNYHGLSESIDEFLELKRIILETKTK